MPLSSSEPLNSTVPHLQFPTLHLKTLSNRVHHRENGLKAVSVPGSGNKAISSFVVNVQSAFWPQLTGLPVGFSWIVLMGAGRVARLASRRPRDPCTIEPSATGPSLAANAHPIWRNNDWK